MLYFPFSEKFYMWDVFIFLFYFTSDAKGSSVSKPVAMKERFRPMPFCLPVIFMFLILLCINSAAWIYYL
jgi:hypothetical protein